MMIFLKGLEEIKESCREFMDNSGRERANKKTIINDYQKKKKKYYILYVFKELYQFLIYII